MNVYWNNTKVNWRDVQELRNWHAATIWNHRSTVRRWAFCSLSTKRKMKKIWLGYSRKEVETLFFSFQFLIWMDISLNYKMFHCKNKKDPLLLMFRKARHARGFKTLLDLLPEKCMNVCYERNKTGCMAQTISCSRMGGKLGEPPDGRTNRVHMLKSSSLWSRLLLWMDFFSLTYIQCHKNKNWLYSGKIFDFVLKTY